LDKTRQLAIASVLSAFCLFARMFRYGWAVDGATAFRFDRWFGTSEMCFLEKASFSYYCGKQGYDRARGN
jgi:hypothetical protein